MFVSGYPYFNTYNNFAFQMSSGLAMLNYLQSFINAGRNNSSSNSIFPSSSSSTGAASGGAAGFGGRSAGVSPIGSKVGDLLTNPNNALNAMSGVNGGNNSIFSGGQNNPLGMSSYSDAGIPAGSMNSQSPFMPAFPNNDYGLNGMSNPSDYNTNRPSIEQMMNLYNQYPGMPRDMLKVNPAMNMNGMSYITMQDSFNKWYEAYCNAQQGSNVGVNQSGQKLSNPSVSSNNMNVTTPYNGTASDLNAHLGGVMRGKGEVFLRAQQQYGINAAFLASICITESANGTSSLAKNKNNVGGVRYSGSYEFRRYSSVDECIMHIAKFLKSGYINKGLTTAGQIGAKYCPSNDPTDKAGTNSLWASTVTSIYNKNFA